MFMPHTFTDTKKAEDADDSQRDEVNDDAEEGAANVKRNWWWAKRFLK